MLFLKNKSKLFFLFLLFTSFVSGQTISGTVKQKVGIPIPMVNIIVKESINNTNIIAYTKTDKYGNFSIEINGLDNISSLKKIVLEVKKHNYKTENHEIGLSKIRNIYKYDFILYEDISTKSIEEVIVVGNKPKFKIKEDTVSFNVKSYKDGTERKIEDIIKKLPGVEVSESSGEIKYKGTSIETVTLDGDNLFDTNYTLGTKNINVDLIDQIQAIDNYSQNPLLKNIEQGGKVSLNLILKKDRSSRSGSIDFGNGWDNDAKELVDVNANMLTTKKRYKDFSTITFNNIGLNYSPINFYGYNLNTETQKEQQYYAEKAISETIFSNALDDKRSNVNNQMFFNYNSIFNVSKKINVRTNFYLLKNNMFFSQSFLNNYAIGNDFFSTYDNTKFVKSPILYRGNVELKYNTSKTSLLEYNFSIIQSRIRTLSDIEQNTKKITTQLQTEDFFVKQNLLWTNRITKNNAFQVSLLQSYSQAPQYLEMDHLGSSFTKQESQYQKKYIETKFNYLGKLGKDKYNFLAGYSHINSPFNSTLFEENVPHFLNQSDYTKSWFYVGGFYHFNFGKFQISPSLNLKFLDQYLDDILSQNSHDTVLEPSIFAKYKLGRNSFLSANIDINSDTNVSKFLFTQNLLVNPRTTVSNIPDLRLQHNQLYKLQYYNNSLYKQYTIEANLAFENTKGNFFSKNFIDENNIRMLYFYLPQNRKSWSADASFSKYIPWIESTLKLSGFLNTSNYKSIINDMGLYDIKHQSMVTNFFWKTSLNGAVNFENSLSWQISKSLTGFQSFYHNSYNDKFKTIANFSKKWFFIVSLNYFLPDTKAQNQYFVFIDAVIKYKPKYAKWDVGLLLNNVTNENNFEQIQTTDFSTQIYRSVILPRNCMVNFSISL